jgi:Rhodanese-like domain
MAKRKHQEVQAESSKAAMGAMVVGGLLVAALVVWALTRTVQTAPADSVATATFPVGVEQPAPTGTLPPLDTTTGLPVQNGQAAQPPQTASQPQPYTPNPPSADENASVTRINVQDLRSKVDAKQVTVIDVRDKTSYVTSHIPGSLHVPMATVESQVSFLPKNKPIVTYCT